MSGPSRERVVVESGDRLTPPIPALSQRDPKPVSLDEILATCAHRARRTGLPPETAIDRGARLALPRLVEARRELVRHRLISSFDEGDIIVELGARGWRQSVVDHLWRNRHDRRSRGGRRAPCTLLVAVAAEHVRDLRGWLLVRGLRTFRSPRGLHRYVARAQPRDLCRLVRAELAELLDVGTGPCLFTLADLHVEGLGLLPLRLAVAVRAMRALLVPAFPTAAYATLVLRIVDEVFRGLAQEPDAQTTAAVIAERDAWVEAHRATMAAGFATGRPA